MKRAERITEAAQSAASNVSATSASARPVTPPPHGFSRGCDLSKSVTRAPWRASTYAARAPAGPAPTIATSVCTPHTRTPHTRTSHAHTLHVTHRTLARPHARALAPSHPALSSSASRPRTLHARTLARRPFHLSTLVIHYTPMVQVDVGRFTLGVFQDLAWAAKGLDALTRAGFRAESLTILAKDSPEASAFIEKALGSPGERLDVAGLGPTSFPGPRWAPPQAPAAVLRNPGLAGRSDPAGFQAMMPAILGPRPGGGAILAA